MRIIEHIKEIILNNQVSTQEELTLLLNKKGVSATQSNISRALKKLGAIKQLDESGKSIYKIPRAHLKVDQYLSNLVIDIKDNGHLVFIKTYPGAANTIAQVVDDSSIELMLGTLAGDDALLVIPKSIDNTHELRKILEKLFLE